MLHNFDIVFGWDYDGSDSELFFFVSTFCSFFKSDFYNESVRKKVRISFSVSFPGRKFRQILVHSHCPCWTLLLILFNLMQLKLFRRPLRRKSSNSSLRSVNSVSSISSISSIASLSGGLNSLRNKVSFLWVGRSILTV